VTDGLAYFPEEEGRRDSKVARVENAGQSKTTLNLSIFYDKDMEANKGGSHRRKKIRKALHLRCDEWRGGI